MLDGLLKFISNMIGYKMYVEVDTRGWEWKCFKLNNGLIIAFCKNDTLVENWNFKLYGNRYLDYLTLSMPKGFIEKQEPYIFCSTNHNTYGLSFAYMPTGYYDSNLERWIFTTYFQSGSAGTNFKAPKNSFSFLAVGYWKEV